MKETYSVSIDAINARKSTDKQSGIKLVFKYADEKLRSEATKTSTRRERFGKLTMEGLRLNLSMEGKYMETQKYSDSSDGKGEHVITFVPGKAPTTKEFTLLYELRGKDITIEFEDSQSEIEFKDGKEAEEPEAAETA